MIRYGVPNAQGGYTQKQLDTGPVKSEGRLAVYNGDLETGVDPLLFGAGKDALPFDNIHNPENRKTQKELLAEMIQEAMQTHKRPARGLTARAALTLIFMDRIRGEDPSAPNYIDHTSSDFVLNRGFLIDPELGRVGIAGGGVSVVGGVYSGVGRLGLTGWRGQELPKVGVGLEMRPSTLV